MFLHFFIKVDDCRTKYEIKFERKITARQILTYRNFNYSSAINLLPQPLLMGSFYPKNRKILKFIHSPLNTKRTKCISLVAYVFALNFLSMKIYKGHKHDKCAHNRLM